MLTRLLRGANVAVERQLVVGDSCFAVPSASVIEVDEAWHVARGGADAPAVALAIVREALGRARLNPASRPPWPGAP